ncbi:MAG: c-type cytochrome [Gaiellaceae bacterium]
MVRAFVRVVQLATVGVLVFAIVMLFTNDPTPPPDLVADATVPASVDAASLYGASCAACHGGDGSGGVGPPVRTGRVLERFPQATDEIAVVANGRGAMPAFGGRLSDEEIAAIVEYTRTSLP